MKYIIETEHLTKRYGANVVVNQVNFHVPKGNVYGLLGRNGAGKTTAMKMMLQLVFPTDGSIRLFGKDCRTMLLPYIGILVLSLKHLVFTVI